jgi:hypothetical protein
MVMHIALDKCPSSDKGVRRKHGRHYHRYSVDTFLLIAIVSPSTVVCGDGGQGATVGTCFALYLCYREIPYSMLG